MLNESDIRPEWDDYDGRWTPAPTWIWLLVDLAAVAFIGVVLLAAWNVFLRA